MPKIALIADFDKFGGTRTFLYNLLDFYQDYHFEVVVIAEHQLLDESIRADLTKRGIVFKCLPLRPSAGPGFIDRLRRGILYELFSILHVVKREKPDVVVISTGTPGHYLTLMPLVSGYIYFLHSYPRNRLNPLLRWIVARFCSTNRMLVTVSNFARKNIEKYWFKGAKNDFVRVIYNSCSNTTSPGNSVFDQSAHQMAVITLGHVTAYKNPQLWIDVARKVLRVSKSRNIKFIWAGDGDQLAACREMVKDNGNIEFVGYRTDIEDLYDLCTVYFQPSLLESHGISVIEAMYHNKPCVVSNVGGLPESVIDGETGYVVDLDDVEEIVARMLKLLEDEPLRSSFGKNGGLRARSVFSRERWTEEMRRLHDDVCGKVIIDRVGYKNGR